MAVTRESFVGCLRIFNPLDDWQVYKNQLNQYFVINGITTDEVKRGLLLNMCSETAYQLICSLCFPAKPETQDFAGLLTMLDAYFTPPKLIFHERQVFYDARKYYQESAAEWAIRVQLLARDCGFSNDELEITLRDRFICGLPEGPVKDRLYEEIPEDLTFEKAVQIARNKEASYRQYMNILPEMPVEQGVFYMPKRYRRWAGDGFFGPQYNRPNHHIGDPFPNPTCSAAMPTARFCDNCAYYWIDTSARSVLPTTAIRGGIDADGSEIYVGRAFHEGDWIPAKVIPSKRVAYVPYGGREHAKDRFQVLCEQRFDWVPSHGGVIPPGAVEGGRTSKGENLYIGRVHHKGSHTVGKVHPSHKVCYIPFDGKEVPYQQYEILVLRS